MPGMQGEGPAPQQDATEKPSITDEELKAAESQESNIPGVTLGQLYEIRNQERASQGTEGLPVPKSVRMAATWPLNYLRPFHIVPEHSRRELISDTLPRSNNNGQEETPFISVVTETNYSEQWAGPSRDRLEDKTTYLIPKRFITPKTLAYLKNHFSNFSEVRYYLGPIKDSWSYEDRSMQIYSNNVVCLGEERVINGMEINGEVVFYETVDEVNLRLLEDALRDKGRDKSKDSVLIAQRDKILKIIQEKAEKIRAEEKQE